MSKLAKALTAAAGNAGEALYVEDVFSTYLVTGTGAAPSVDNGIDLDGEGGLVWLKKRSSLGSHDLFDTERGANKRLSTNTTNAEDSKNLSFTSTGFSNYTLDSAVDYASWTFRKAPKFFDVVTYTGNGVAGRTVAHNLGSVPAMIIVKSTDGAGQNWRVYHTSLGATSGINLNDTGSSFGFAGWNNTAPTDSVFSVNASGYSVNDSGFNYVAYLFASDAGGFGDDDESIIKCGSFTTDASGNAVVSNLGFEPSWLMIKRSSGAGNWEIRDDMRGFGPGASADLKANVSDAESSPEVNKVFATATGFEANVSTSSDYIYIAIRRPMKTPESGTEVFAATYGDGTAPAFEGVLTDFALQKDTSGGNWLAVDRMRGTKALQTQDTSVESNASYAKFDYMDGWNSLGFTSPNFSWMFKRATGFFDVVAYTGDGGTTQTLNHNLGVTPELMIAKRRNDTQNWVVYHSSNGAGKYYNLNTTVGVQTLSTVWGGVEPTSTQFTVGNSTTVNFNGDNYIAYLFATLAGVSKVGSYTGNGTSQTIDCGFSGGARFVLIKSTSTTGSWWVYDSARGIVAGNDPALQLNSTAAEVTSADAIDPDSSGFIVNQEATCSINASGVSYIFMSIA